MASPIVKTYAIHYNAKQKYRNRYPFQISEYKITQAAMKHTQAKQHTKNNSRKSCTAQEICPSKLKQSTIPSMYQMINLYHIHQSIYLANPYFHLFVPKIICFPKNTK